MELNEDCPLCFSSDDKMFVLSCELHQLHLSCAQGLTKSECPLCFAPITNFPKDIVDKINLNGKDYNAKLEEDDIRELRELISESNASEANTSYLFQVKIEAIAAIVYLKENGVPAIYIPHSINISIYRHAPTPSEGTYYRAIISHAIERMYIDSKPPDVLTSGVLDNMTDEGEFGYKDYDEDYDENENPFNGAHIRFSINNIHVNEI